MEAFSAPTPSGRSCPGLVPARERPAEQAKPSPAGTASAGPGGPGRGDHSGGDGSRAAGRDVSVSERERARRPAARPSTAQADVWRRLRRDRQPAGRSGVPAGLTRAGTTRGNVALAQCTRDVPARVLQERRVRARYLAHTPPPAGSHSYRTQARSARSASRAGCAEQSDSAGRRRTADRVTPPCRWRAMCRSGSFTLQRSHAFSGKRDEQTASIFRAKRKRRSRTIRAIPK